MKQRLIHTIKYIIISLPVLAFLLLIGLLNVSGEFQTIENVIDLQNSNDKIIFGPAYSNKDVEYKTYNTLNRRPNILCVGTSRVMQFNKDSFSDTFYNAGGIINRISQIPILLYYLKNTGYIPQTLIIGLDQYFFNENWDKVDYDAMYEARINEHKVKMNPTPISIVGDIFRSKVDILKIIHSDSIGLNAKMHLNGFTADGMYYYGGLIVNNIEWDKNFSDTFSRIKKGEKRFEYAENINKKAITEFLKIRDFCTDNNISVIYILPPYAPSVWEKMIETNNYKYIEKIFPLLSNLLSGNDNQKIYDFSFIKNSDDTQFYDGFHGNDEIYKYIANVIK